MSVASGEHVSAVTVESLVVALQSIRGVGDAAIEAILRGIATQNVAPADVVAMDPTHLQRRFGLAQAQANRIADGLPSVGRHAEELVRQLRHSDVAILTIGDAAYPQRLAAALDHPPAAIYCHGNAAMLRRPMIAVANSNGASREARDAAIAALGAAIECGFAVVTGHNRPEYQDAALAAYRRGASCCYVLDRGILTVGAATSGSGLFPGARIWRDPGAPGSDLVLSGCAATMPAVTGSNQRRDAIILGLASVAIATHVRPGGTMERLLTRAAQVGTRIAWIGPGQPPTSLRAQCPDLRALESHRDLVPWLE